MYEYRIENKVTGKDGYIFGYCYEDACKRAGLNPDDYEIISLDYID